MIDCEPDPFARVVIDDPDAGQVVDIPLVTPEFDAIDLGAELRVEHRGARVVDVADEARDAGLQAGDVVTAIDGISVAGMSVPTVRELGFRLPHGHAVTFDVLRGDQALTIHLRAPAK